MKKILANLAAKPLVKGILKVADSAVLGGLVHNIQEETKDHPKGKIDVPKLVGSLIPIALLIMLGLGIITINDIEELMKIF